MECATCGPTEKRSGYVVEGKFYCTQKCVIKSLKLCMGIAEIEFEIKKYDDNQCHGVST